MRAVRNVVALRDEILAAIIRHKESGYPGMCTCGVQWRSGKHIENIITLVIDKNTTEAE